MRLKKGEVVVVTELKFKDSAVDDLSFRFEGYEYIWSIRRSDGEFVEKRLDRVLVTEFWLDF